MQDPRSGGARQCTIKPNGHKTAQHFPDRQLCGERAPTGILSHITRIDCCSLSTETTRNLRTKRAHRAPVKAGPSATLTQTHLWYGYMKHAPF